MVAAPLHTCSGQGPQHAQQGSHPEPPGDENNDVGDGLRSGGGLIGAFHLMRGAMGGNERGNERAVEG